MTLHIVPIKNSSLYRYFLEHPTGASWESGYIIEFKDILLRLRHPNAIVKNDVSFESHCKPYLNTLDIDATITIDTDEISTLPQLRSHYPELFI